MINSTFILALLFTFKYLVWFLWTNVDVGSLARLMKMLHRCPLVIQYH